MKTIVWFCCGAPSLGAESKRTRHLGPRFDRTPPAVHSSGEESGLTGGRSVVHNVSFMIESHQIENGVEKAGEMQLGDDSKWSL
jgi:hypothetical protein